MGYIASATSTTLTAKLTPTGRRKLILTNNNLITSFSLGDSDANYYAANILTTGEVPSDGGTLGANGVTSNSVPQNTSIKSFLVVNSTGSLRKSVEQQSTGVTISYDTIGETVITGTNVTQNVINRTDFNTDSLVNLYYSFNLPLNSTDDYKFTGLTQTYGGFSNTGLSGMAATTILAIAVNNTQYGELIDGKSIKLEMVTTGGTVTIYSTFQNSGISPTVLDTSYSDPAPTTTNFGSNIAFLVSDNIRKPNGDTSLSWATGYGTVKPFSLNGKKLYNLTTNSNLSQTADTVVGIAYLDKGIFVITNPTIINSYNVTTGVTTVTLDSVSTSVQQNITCIAERGEFGVSTNASFKTGDVPRISEVGLYDADNDLIALAKFDRHVEKKLNEFLAIGIKLAM